MAGDDDIIYVDVQARLDEEAAEKATGRLRDKLKDGVKGAGKAVSDVFHSELAQELGRSIGPVAHDMGVELGKQLGSKAGDLLHEQISDALKGVGVDFDGILDKAHDLADQFGVDADSVGKLADAFKAAKTGDQAKAFDDLAQALQKVPGPVGDVAQKSKGLLDTFSSLKGDIKETAHGFMDLTNNSGAIAGGLQAIASAAGPLAATFAALDTLMPGFDQHLNNVLGQVQGKQPFNAKDWFNTLVPGTNLFDKAMQPFVGPTSGNSPIPAKPGVPVIPTPGSTPATPPGYTATPGSLDPFSALMPPGMAAPSGPGISSIAPPDTGGGIPAHTSGASVPLIQNPDGTITSSNPSWAHLIRRESSGRNIRQGIIDVNSGGNEAEGYFQITPSTWRSHGGTAFAPTPMAATPQQQASIAARILQGNPSGSDWGAGLPGRESASGLLGGLMGSSSPIPATLSGFTTASEGGGGFPASPAGFGVPGMPGLPSPGLVAPPTMPNMGGGGGAGPVSQQQVGSGSGVGVTGGGALGMAEQAGVMAAAMFGFGGGGMAAQIGMQEMNLAIQKGGQMGATLAMALPETFGIKGGQMGAPAIGQGGWIHKIIGGLMGQQFNSPNIAGATQPPKKQQQGEEGQPQEDPLNANKSPQGQAGGGGKQGPSGHKDDPIHVQQVPPPGGAPQGQATSAMNTSGVLSAITA